MNNQGPIHARTSHDGRAVPQYRDIVEDMPTRKLGRGFWIGFWGLACLGLMWIDQITKVATFY